jgi:hypothetical protein
LRESGAAVVPEFYEIEAAGVGVLGWERIALARLEVVDTLGGICGQVEVNDQRWARAGTPGVGVARIRGDVLDPDVFLVEDNDRGHVG